MMAAAPELFRRKQTRFGTVMPEHINTDAAVQTLDTFLATADGASLSLHYNWQLQSPHKFA